MPLEAAVNLPGPMKPIVRNCSFLGLFVFGAGILPSNGQEYFYDQHYFEPQVRWEAGMVGGPMIALTDLGGTAGKGSSGIKDINGKCIHFYRGIFLQAHLGRHWTFRLQSGWGRVSGADSLIPKGTLLSDFRLQRNLHFNSPIREALALVQWEPGLIRKLIPSSGYTLYILGGLGLYHFNPRAQINGNWIALHGLHTEGQGFPEYGDRRNYSLIQWNLPFGAGLSVDLTPQVFIQVEGLYRKLFTDYLDDVSTEYAEPSLFDKRLPPATAVLALQLADRRISNSQTNSSYLFSTKRGNPARKDNYFSLQILVGFVFNRKRR